MSTTTIDELVRENIRKIITRRGLNMAAAAKRCGLGKTYFNDFISGRTASISKNRTEIARGLDVSVAYIDGDLMAPDDASEPLIRFDEKPELDLYVPIVGTIVGTGDVVFSDTRRTLPERVKSPPIYADSDTVALRVRGDALGPLLAEYLVFFRDRREAPTDRVINRSCVVGLYDSRVVIRVVRLGSQPGKLTLVPMFGSPSEDVSALWVSEILGFERA